MSTPTSRPRPSTFAHTPLPRRRRPASFLAALTLATLTIPHAARAERGDVEISATSEATVFASGSTSATTSDRAAWTPQLRVGYGVSDELTALLGWRSMALLSRGDSGYALDTDVEMFIATVRWTWPVTAWFRVDAELDLEALHADFELTLDTHHGSAGAWGFGAVPKVAAVFSLDLDGLDLDLRLHAGFALRTDLAADPLHLSTGAEADQVRPLDLGATNLSGLVVGLGAAVVF